LCGIRIVCGPKFVHECENAAAIIDERSLQNNNSSLGQFKSRHQLNTSSAVDPPPLTKAAGIWRFGAKIYAKSCCCGLILNFVHQQPSAAISACESEADADTNTHALFINALSPLPPNHQR
jgi:hypothetical protein